MIHLLLAGVAHPKVRFVLQRAPKPPTNRTSLWQSALFLSHKCLPSFDVFGHSALLDACGLGILSWVVQEQFLTINPNLTVFSLLTTLKTWRPNEKSGEQWLWSLHLFCETSAALKLRLSMVSYNAALGSCTKAGFWKRMCSCADVQLVCYVFTFFWLYCIFWRSFTVSIPLGANIQRPRDTSEQYVCRFL